MRMQPTSVAPARVAVPRTHATALRRTLPRIRWANTLITLLAYAVAALMLLPIWWMVSQSLTAEQDIYQWPLRLIPDRPTLSNYTQIFSKPDVPMARWYFNSLLTAFGTTGLVLAVSSLAAYGYARLEFPGRNLLFFGLLATLMIPGTVTFIPVFLILRDLHLIDTYWALILPHAAGVFGVFLLRQFMKSIPRELEEAAVLDGANRLQIFWWIIVPLSRSALAALGIFVFLASWNDFLWPFVATNDMAMRTLPVGLTIFNGEYITERGMVMAGAAISSVPVLIVYAFFQQHIVKSLAMTGLKG